MGTAARTAPTRASRSNVLILAIFALLVAACPATAKEPREKPKPKTTRVETVGKWAYERLSRAQKALEEGKTSAALAALDEMKGRADRLNEHERAMMWQTYGYVQSAGENYTAAAASFEKALAEGGLPAQAVENTRYNLAQLYVVSEQYERAIEQFRLWFETAENPQPEAHFMFAMAYLRADHPREALAQAKQAVAKSEAPQESWLQLLLSLHLQLDHYREALPVLQQLIDRFPNKSYWLQLAAVHSELGEHKQALGVMELAYEQGYLTTGRELINLAKLYLYNEIPYEAAKVLQEGMASGAVEANAESWKLLADSLLLARERERATEPLSRAAELSSDGNLFVRLAQIEIDAQRWPAAVSALEKAIAKGGLQDPGGVYLLLGVANVSEGRDAEARRAFTAAQKYEKTKGSAGEWLARLDSEQRIAQGDGEIVSETASASN